MANLQSEASPGALRSGRQPGFFVRNAKTTTIVLVLLGCVGLALHLWLSLWVFQSRVGPNLRIEHPAVLVPGSRIPLRVDLRNADLQPETIESEVVVYFQSKDATKPPVYLGKLSPYLMRSKGVRSRAEGEVELPTNVSRQSGFLEFELESEEYGTWKRRCEVKVGNEIPARKPSVIRESEILRQADQSEEQPSGYIIELRPEGDLRAPFVNTIWLRITDDKGDAVEGWVEVFFYQGNWRLKGRPGKNNPPNFVARQWLTKPGIMAFSGSLDSDTIGFEVRYYKNEKAKKAEKPAAKRKIMLRAVPGGEQLRAAPILRGQGDNFRLRYRSLAPGRKASFDIHDAQGRWIARCGDPRVGSEESFECAPPLSAGLFQIEAYAGVRRFQPGASFARVWLDTEKISSTTDSAVGTLDSEKANRKRRLPPETVEWMRKMVKEWPVAEQKALKHYLDTLESQSWNNRRWSLLVTWLISATPPAVFAAPVVYDTFKSAGEDLKAYKQRWALRLRLFLWGGGILYLLLVAVWVYRSQHFYFEQLQETLGAENLDAKALSSPSRAAVLRMMGIVAVLAFCLILLALFMESLVTV